MLISPTINHVHGRIRSITGTDPAAGAEISETVPARRRWLIHAIIFSLVTSVDEANRIVRLILDDGTNEFYRLSCTTAQTASLTHTYNYAHFAHDELIVGTVRHYNLPPFPLGPGYRIKTITGAIEAADNFGTPQILVEEWIDP